MAVLQMQRIYICALKKNRKQILELLQRRGVLEVNEMIPEDSIFRKTDVSAAESLLEKNVIVAKEAIQILETYVPEKKSMLAALNGRNEVAITTYNEFYKKHNGVVHTANRISLITKQIAELKAEILKLNAQNEMLTAWTSLDIPLNFAGTKYTTSFIGTLPLTWTLDMIYEKLAQQTPLNVDIISTSREQTCVFILCAKEQSDEVTDTLRAIGFANATLTSHKIPSEKRIIIEKQIAAAELEISTLKQEIESYADEKDNLLFLVDYDTMRKEKYEAISHILHSKSVFVIGGYVAEKESASLEDALNEKFELSIEIENPSKAENVPILLYNNGFAKPLEGTVEAYSLPGKGEIDPTMVMSLFYYMLFGLMLSDAGYGAIIAIACGACLFKFRKTIEESAKNTLKMFLFCGISTIFWGVMFGSYFGNIYDVVASNFFGSTSTLPPLWFFPVNEPMRMLVFSLLIGILHIFAGLLMKFYLCIKHGDFKSAVYDVVLWLTLLISSIMMLLSTEMIVGMFNLNIAIPKLVASISITIFAASAVGIVLTSGRESKNPFKRFLKGLYGLYGITGYLSDVLSYSRLLALGLATGVIATVINTMAGMAGGGVIGAILFTVICIVGHSLNLGINALGAYVHTNRLQYVEFFGKFYDGGGRKFKPFSVKTKYFKFREEQ